MTADESGWLEELLDQYCNHRSLRDPIDETVLRSICAAQPELLPRLREDLSAAREGARLLDFLEMPSISSLHLSAPAFNDIRLIEPVGRGGYSYVYRATQRVGNEQRDIAIKFLPKGGLSRESFDREIRVLSVLGNARNVPKLHAAGEHAGYWYVAMNWIHGFSLEDIVRQRVERNESASRAPNKKLYSAFSRAEVAVLLDGVLSVLIGAGREYENYLLNSEDRSESPHILVHGDIKPANILLQGAKFSDLWLVDFGVSQLKDEGLLGLTDAYACPEMFTPVPLGHDRRLTPRSDVFQIACIGFELVCGQRYWDCDEPTRMQLLKQINQDGPLGRAIVRGLLWDPSSRFNRTTDFLHAIRTATWPRDLARRTLRSARTWQVMLLLLMAALTPLFLWQKEKHETMTTRFVELQRQNAATLGELEASEAARKKAELEAGGKNVPPSVYRDARDAYLQMASGEMGWTDLCKKTWRDQMQVDLGFLRGDRRYDADLRVTRVVDWFNRLTSLNSGITIRMTPAYLEPFGRTWYGGAKQKTLSYSVKSGDVTKIESEKETLKQRKDLNDRTPIEFNWNIDEPIELTLHADGSETPFSTTVSDELIKRLVAGGLAEGLEFETHAADAMHGKIVFILSVTSGELPPPPPLPALSPR